MQYSIFYHEDSGFFPLFYDKEGVFWLGGSRLTAVGLFNTRKAANTMAIKIRKQKRSRPFFRDGKIVVAKARIQPS